MWDLVVIYLRKGELEGEQEGGVWWVNKLCGNGIRRSEGETFTSNC